jgi:hypothetical protein
MTPATKAMAVLTDVAHLLDEWPVPGPVMVRNFGNEWGMRLRVRVQNRL